LRKTPKLFGINPHARLLWGTTGAFMLWYFLGFITLVIGLLALDLGVFHRQDKIITIKASLGWTGFWIALSLVFNGFIYWFYEHHWLGIGLEHNISGQEAAITFFTAYLVEKSLSIDNIFIIAMIFSYFKVPQEFQHRVLFWGITGALIMRALMIIAGISAISYFSWVLYLLGAMLIITAIRMLIVSDDKFEPEKNILVRLISKFIPVTHNFHGHNFFIKINKKLTATPLFLALILIESMDLLFAIDSIPAVLAISLDPFIVFTSNVFAILGMRSLYFALASLIDKFRYLKTSLVFILAFVGTKMILSHHVPIDSLISLAVIVGILLVGIFASLLSKKTKKA
jgi:tellurite resistance protein TerC